MPVLEMSPAAKQASMELISTIDVLLHLRRIPPGLAVSVFFDLGLRACLRSDRGVENDAPDQPEALRAAMRQMAARLRMLADTPPGEMAAVSELRSDGLKEERCESDSSID